ncbi:UBN2_3 domain-containing protein, partial [Cephalotus follicularis]
DPASPYFLHVFDQLGSPLITQFLVGDNYSTWRLAVTMALEAKNKLVFINGIIQKPVTEPDASAWLRCNNMVTSWLIHSTTPTIANSVMWIQNAHEALHDELFSYRTAPPCTCGVLPNLTSFLDEDYLMDFLQGKNDSYASVCSQLLLMDPLLSVNKAYSLLLQEERQRSLTS